MKRWKRVEYERLVDRGVFEPGDRLELIDGLLLVSEPQSSPHYTAIRLVERVLARAFGEGWDVRAQAPIALDEAWEPEPDVAVVRGAPRDYSTSHPAHPVLVVAVAASSLDVDREHKASPSARARGPVYWVVSLLDRGLEVRGDVATRGLGDAGRRLGGSSARVDGRDAHASLGGQRVRRGRGGRLRRCGRRADGVVHAVRGMRGAHPRRANARDHGAERAGH